jgi:ligand-binding sensor protein
MQSERNNQLPVPAAEPSPNDSAPPGDRRLAFSPALRADLLDPQRWGEVLDTYARTMKLAVALTNQEGRLIGTCHGPQPVWRLVREAMPAWGATCPFCLAPRSRCTAVADALRTGPLVLVHDQAGLAHVAVPLMLGDDALGALIAGQVFDRYPESLRLEGVANECGLSAQQLWSVAAKQIPVSRASLMMGRPAVDARAGVPAATVQRYSRTRTHRDQRPFPTLAPVSIIRG